jgi:ABC-type dipeptide/oligopeptide/nickel transport system permease component
MLTFLIRRLIGTVFVIFGGLALIFFIIQMSGDPVLMMLPLGATDAEIETFRHLMGLDKPLFSRFLNFMANVLKGDFGVSYYHHRPALDLVLERLPATLLLTVTSTFIALAVSIPIGIVSAVKKGSLLDHLGSVFVLVGQSVPTFYIGILLILFVAVRLHILPTSGTGTWKHLILPSVTLATFTLATIMRVVRSSMLEVLDQHFIRTARAKGLPETVVILKHALKNASISIITVIGVQIGMIITAAFITEIVFSWPGVGRLAVSAIYQRDLPLIQASVFLSAAVFIIINFIIDIIYSVIDPRVKLE